MCLTRVGGRDDGGIDLVGWWWTPALIPAAGESRTDSRRRTIALESSSSPLHIAGGAVNTGARRRIRVIAQCKAEKKKMGPKYVRELEGVVSRHIAIPRFHDKLQDRNVANHSSATPTPEGSHDTRAGGGEEDHSFETDVPVSLLISQSPFTKAAILRARSSPLPFFLLHLPPLPQDPFPFDPCLLASALGSSQRSTATMDVGNDSSFDSRTAQSGIARHEDEIGAAIWNSALAGPRGIFRGEMELRWERGRHGLSGSATPCLWWQGNPVGNWRPPSQLTAQA